MANKHTDTNNAASATTNQPASSNAPAESVEKSAAIVVKPIKTAAAPIAQPLLDAKKPSKPSKTKAQPPAKEKVKKLKLVRESFTMAKTEYQLLVDTKKACIQAGFKIKKSELLRIGVALIQKTEKAQLKGMLDSLPPLKAGRPKKAK